MCSLLANSRFFDALFTTASSSSINEIIYPDLQTLMEGGRENKAYQAPLYNADALSVVREEIPSLSLLSLASATSVEVPKGRRDIEAWEVECGNPRRDEVTTTICRLLYRLAASLKTVDADLSDKLKDVSRATILLLFELRVGYRKQPGVETFFMKRAVRGIYQPCSLVRPVYGKRVSIQ